MVYNAEIVVGAKEAAVIKRYLEIEPTCAEECLHEDETIVHTAVFENGAEVDVKCCGVQFEDGECNTAWCEAVLFIKNGKSLEEVLAQFAEDDYFGEYVFNVDDDVYVVNVVVGD